MSNVIFTYFRPKITTDRRSTITRRIILYNEYSARLAYEVKIVCTYNVQ